MVSTRTFPPTTSDKGFTLIELIVVIAIIAVIGAFAIPSISSYFRMSVRTVSREMASVVKEAYNSTMITGRVHRLAYDLEAQSFWVESGPPGFLLDTEESLEKEERRKRWAKLNSGEKPKSKFSMDRSITRSKITLPRGVAFEDIYTEREEDPVTEGMAYTHFFPHGVTEQTIIHLIDSNQHKTSLVISALTGKTRVMEEYVSAKEIFGR